MPGLLDRAFHLQSGRHDSLTPAFFERGDRSRQRLVHRFQTDRDVLPALLGRGVHLIEDIADGIHDPARVPQTQISQTQVVGAFGLELEVMSHPGSMSLPLIGVSEMFGESATVTAGQLDGSLVPGRAVVVPQMIDPLSPERGSDLREVGDDVVHELVREAEGVWSRVPGVGLRHAATIYGLP